MYIPAAREHVEIVGRPGVFLVVGVDRDAGTADLLPTEDNMYWAEPILFELIRPMKQDAE